MRIIIKKLDGQKEPFNVEEADTVRYFCDMGVPFFSPFGSKLKEMLAEKAGVHKDQIRLILRGQPMVDDKVSFVARFPDCLVADSFGLQSKGW